MQLVLASQSPYRRAQLEQFGVRFTAEKPLVDEERLKLDGPADLVELTRFLSLKKAESLAQKYPDALILGCDQLADFQGQRLDKPGSVENARDQLARLSGNEHRLITSLAMIYRGQNQLFTDITKVRFKKLNSPTINAYVAVDFPVDCAGSYKIEKAGLSLVEKIQSDDFSAIQGLPLLSFARGLEKLGIPLTELWETR